MKKMKEESEIKEP